MLMEEENYKLNLKILEDRIKKSDKKKNKKELN